MDLSRKPNLKQMEPKEIQEVMPSSMEDRMTKIETEVGMMKEIMTKMMGGGEKESYTSRDLMAM